MLRSQEIKSSDICMQGWCEIEASFLHIYTLPLMSMIIWMLFLQIRNIDTSHGISQRARIENLHLTPLQPCTLKQLQLNNVWKLVRLKIYVAGIFFAEVWHIIRYQLMYYLFGTLCTLLVVSREESIATWKDSTGPNNNMHTYDNEHCLRPTF